jgi:chorismate synthase
MAGNMRGTLFSVTSFDKWHGPVVGSMDACPPNLTLCEADIQAKPGWHKPGSSGMTPRHKREKSLNSSGGRNGIF